MEPREIEEIKRVISAYREKKEILKDRERHIRKEVEERRIPSYIGEIQIIELYRQLFHAQESKEFQEMSKKASDPNEKEFEKAFRETHLELVFDIPASGFRTFDFMRDFSTAKAWAELNKAGFTKSNATAWSCSRFDIKGLQVIEKMIGCLPRAMVICADGPKLQILQNELANLGVTCSIPNTDENYHFNRMVIWCMY